MLGLSPPTSSPPMYTRPTSALAPYRPTSWSYIPSSPYSPTFTDHWRTDAWQLEARCTDALGRASSYYNTDALAQRPQDSTQFSDEMWDALDSIRRKSAALRAKDLEAQWVRAQIEQARVGACVCSHDLLLDTELKSLRSEVARAQTNSAKQGQSLATATEQLAKLQKEVAAVQESLQSARNKAQLQAHRASTQDDLKATERNQNQEELGAQTKLTNDKFKEAQKHERDLAEEKSATIKMKAKVRELEEAIKQKAQVKEKVAKDIGDTKKLAETKEQELKDFKQAMKDLLNG